MRRDRRTARRRARPSVRIAAAAVALGTLAGAAQAREPELRLELRNARIEPLPWRALDGWQTDDQAAAYAAFKASCGAILKAGHAARRARPMLDGLYQVCGHARAGRLDDAKARAFFEAHFRPVRIAPLDDGQGFLTGYYESVFEGSLHRTDAFTVPVYRAPPELVAAGHRRGAKFPSSGAKVGRKHGRDIVPFYDRAAIEDGALAGRGLEICWVKSPVDLFFAQIQGSARVRLQDGRILRLNYDAHNGYPYYPVGRDLIDRGIIPREQMSMQRIRDWMSAHPDEARELRRKNRSFVFFRDTGLADHQEPVGAQGVALTTGRSIAVDKSLHVYGTPFWIEAELPLDGDNGETPFRRLMVAQDTGSAIVGPARADIYFGAGEEIGRVAGRIKQPGRFVMLLPRALDPARLARVPLPRPRPAPAMLAADAPSESQQAKP